MGAWIYKCVSVGMGVCVLTISSVSMCVFCMCVYVYVLDTVCADVCVCGSEPNYYFIEFVFNNSY